MHTDVHLVLQQARRLRETFADAAEAMTPSTALYLRNEIDDRYDNFAMLVRSLAPAARRFRLACQCWAECAMVAAADDRVDYRLVENKAFENLLIAADGQLTWRQARRGRLEADRILLERTRDRSLSEPWVSAS